MQRRALEQLVFQPDARTGLIRSHEAVVQVEAHAVVNGQLLDRLPFVLQVAAVNPGLQRDVVDERRSGRRDDLDAVDLRGMSTHDCRSRRARRRNSLPAETCDSVIPW